MRIFGDTIDTHFLETSLSLPAYETMYYWQLLAAEIQGNTQRVEQFFQQEHVATILKTQCKRFTLFQIRIQILTSLYLYS